MNIKRKRFILGSFVFFTVLSILILPGLVNAGYYDYTDTLLVVNDSSTASVAIGNYFLSKRPNFPSNHVVHITAVTTETVSRANYNSQIKTPIETFITTNGLSGTINYVILTKGVPIRITDTTNSVDSELAWCLGKASCSVSAMLSPYYNSSAKFSQATYNMYLVTRLDGYAPDGSLTQIEALIDHTTISTMPTTATIKSTGLFVLDGGGLYDSIANPMLDRANTLLLGKGFQTVLDKTSTYLTAKTNVIGYYSWGSNANGSATKPAYAIPGNTYLNGAIGETAVSTSARSFAYPPSYGQSLIADWIKEGISGMKGYTAEPYMDAVAHPDILFDRYTSGFNLAESYYAASELTSWKDIVVGDPKAFIVPIIMPGLISPTTNASTYPTSPTFSWTAAESYNGTITKYQLYIDGVLNVDNISGTSTAPASPLSVGAHTWYVVAYDSEGNTSQSTTYSYTVIYSPSTVFLSAPTTNSSFYVKRPTFSWTAAQTYNGTVAKYQLYVDGVLNTDNISGTSTQAASTISVGSHTWYIVTYDDLGHTSQSSSRTFTVLYSPSTVTLSTPGNGSQTNSVSPTFSWTAAESHDGVISKYQLYIDGALNVDNISGTSTQPASELTLAYHNWYVKAYDDLNSVSQSSSYTIYVTTDAVVDGVCGLAHNSNLSSIPSANLCSVGTASSVSGSGPWTWTCTGLNTGTTASCSANLSVNAVCGEFDGENFYSAPSTNLCSVGTASSVSGSGPWTWTCTGLNSGTDASCSANLSVDGACGTANGQSILNISNTSELCSAGDYTNLSGSSPWTWNCKGSNSGTTASCSANQAIEGVCGSSNGQSFSAKTFNELCYIGTASSVSGSGPWTWTCAAADKTASCSANLSVNAVCGSSNSSNFSSAPSTNLCSVGTASSVSGSGPWTWTCTGVSGGASASCTTASSANAVCGSSNNSSFSSAPSNDLCSVGTASSVSGSGPWTWTCAGLNGGASASCSASQASSGGGGGGGGGGSSSSSTTTTGTCGTSSGKSFSSIPTVYLCSVGTASSVSGSGPWTWTCTNSTSVSCYANFSATAATGSATTTAATSTTTATATTTAINLSSLTATEKEQLIVQLKAQIATLVEQVNQMLKSGATSASTSTVTTTGFSFSTTLYLGIYLSDVAKLQNFLNTHGFPVSASGVGSLGKETNYFGSATQKALMLYQTSVGLDPVGVLGPKTRAIINETLSSLQ